MLVSWQIVLVSPGTVPLCPARGRVLAIRIPDTGLRSVGVRSELCWNRARARVPWYHGSLLQAWWMETPWISRTSTNRSRHPSLFVLWGKRAPWTGAHGISSVVFSASRFSHASVPQASQAGGFRTRIHRTVVRHIVRFLPSWNISITPQKVHKQVTTRHRDKARFPGDVSFFIMSLYPSRPLTLAPFLNRRSLSSPTLYRSTVRPYAVHHSLRQDQYTTAICMCLPIIHRHDPFTRAGPETPPPLGRPPACSSAWPARALRRRTPEALPARPGSSGRSRAVLPHPRARGDRWRRG